MAGILNELKFSYPSLRAHRIQVISFIAHVFGKQMNGNALDIATGKIHPGYQVLLIFKKSFIILCNASVSLAKEYTVINPSLKKFIYGKTGNT